MVLLELEIVHFRVAFVAHSVSLLITPRQLASCLRTDLADRCTTFLAMANRIFTERSREGSFTEHAVVSRVAFNFLQIEFNRQVVDCLIEETAL